MNEVLDRLPTVSDLTLEFCSSRRVVVEIGMGRQGSTYLVDVEGIQGSRSVFVGIDSDARALNRLKPPRQEGMVVVPWKADAFSASFTEKKELDGCVDLLYAFNFLDAAGKMLSAEEAERFFNKIARMLKDDGTVVLGHWYSSELAHFVKEFPFDTYGLDAQFYEGQACENALIDSGFTAHLVSQTAAHDPLHRFVIVLKRKP